MENNSQPNLNALDFVATLYLTTNGVANIIKVEVYAVKENTDWFVITIITKYF